MREFIFSNIDLFIFIWNAILQKGPRERELVHPPNGQSWASPGPGGRSFLKVSQMGTGTQGLEPSFNAFPGNKQRTARLGCWHCRWRIRLHQPQRGFILFFIAVYKILMILKFGTVSVVCRSLPAIELLLLNCYLCQHSTLEWWFWVSIALLPVQLLANGAWEGGRKLPKCLASCHPFERFRWSSGFLISACPALALWPLRQWTREWKIFSFHLSVTPSVVSVALHFKWIK